MSKVVRLSDDVVEMLEVLRLFHIERCKEDPIDAERFSSDNTVLKYALYAALSEIKPD